MVDGTLYDNNDTFRAINGPSNYPAPQHSPVSNTFSTPGIAQGYSSNPGGVARYQSVMANNPQGNGVFGQSQYYDTGVNQQQPGAFQNAFGSNGWVSPVAQTGLGLYQAYLGHQQLNEARDNNRFNRILAESNFGNSVTAYNQRLDSHADMLVRNGIIPEGERAAYVQTHRAKGLGEN